MIRVTYTASREIAGAHAAGDVVTLSFSASEVTPGREVSRDQQKAIGGQRETLHHYGLRTWSVTTGVIEGAEIEALTEFLASVEGGESFTLEPWRYEAGASLDLDFAGGRLREAEAATCTLSSEGFSLTRLEGIGTGGADDFYQASFSAIESP
jgi:hypothetical protein